MNLGKINYIIISKFFYSYKTGGNWKCTSKSLCCLRGSCFRRFLVSWRFREHETSPLFAQMKQDPCLSLVSSVSCCSTVSSLVDILSYSLSFLLSVFYCHTVTGSFLLCRTSDIWHKIQLCAETVILLRLVCMSPS